MKRLLSAVALSLTSAAAWAHPGVHHLNGVGHSVTGSDTWLVVAAVGIWALAQAVMVRAWMKRRENPRKDRR